MKKVIAILLLFVYATSIAGIGLKTFYCCNKLKSISPVILLDKSIARDKSRNDGGCCDTKYSFFKVKDNHKAAAGLTAPVQPVFTILFDICNPPVHNRFYSNIQVDHRSNAPPLCNSRPSYIVNCVYRI